MAGVFVFGNPTRWPVPANSRYTLDHLKDILDVYQQAGAHAPADQADAVGTATLIQHQIAPDKIRDDLIYVVRTYLRNLPNGNFFQIQRKKIRELFVPEDITLPYKSHMELLHSWFSHKKTNPSVYDPYALGAHNEWSTHNARAGYPSQLYFYAPDFGTTLGVVIQHGNNVARLRVLAPFQSPSHFRKVVGNQNVRMPISVRDAMWISWGRNEMPLRRMLTYEIRKQCLDLVHTIGISAGDATNQNLSLPNHYVYDTHLVVPRNPQYMSIGRGAAEMREAPWQILLAPVHFVNNRYMKGVINPTQPDFSRAPNSHYHLNVLHRRDRTPNDSFLQLTRANTFVWNTNTMQNHYFQCMKAYYDFQPRLVRYALMGLVEDAPLDELLTSTLKDNRLLSLGTDQIANTIRFYQLVKHIQKATNNMQRPITGLEFRKYVRNPDQELDAAWNMISILAPQSSRIVKPYRYRRYSRRPTLRL